MNQSELRDEVCKNGNIDLIDKLMSAGYGYDASYLFRLACKYGHLHIINKFLELEEKYGKINIHEGDDVSAFINACENGHLHIIIRLIELEPTHGKIDIHWDFERAFMRACLNGHLHIINKLLELEETHGKIDIHKNSENSFIYACKYGHLHIINKLLELEKTHGKINIHSDDFTDNNDEQSFRWACHYGYENVVKKLLELEETHGQIDIHAWEEYACVYACLNGHTKIVSILLELSETHGAIDFKKVAHQVSEIMLSCGDMYKNFKLSEFAQIAKNQLNKKDSKEDEGLKGDEESRAAMMFFELANILLPTENSKSSSSYMSMDNYEFMSKNKNYVAKKVDIPEIRIAGIDELKDKIIGEITATRKIELDDPELFKDLGIQHEKGVLLHGPPGTGKTLLAKALINQISAELNKNGIETRYLVINGPEIVNKYVGETEKNIRMIFDNSANCRNNKVFFIYVFDEFDSMVPRRQSDSKSWENKPINQFLTMIDGIDTPQNFFIIATTNMKDLIDPAILRSGRIGLDYQIDMPDQSKKEEIIKFYFEKLIKHNIIDCVDYKILAKKMVGFTPADIASLSQKLTRKWCHLDKKKLCNSEIDGEINEMRKKTPDDKNLTYFM